MKALIWYENGQTELVDRPFPEIIDPRDAIVKVTLSSVCTSDLHIIRNAVPKAVPKTVLGHEFVGEIVQLGNAVTNLKIGDRVSANCETFCGECWFCRHGFINNCERGGWEIGCKIDGCHAEYVRVPFADTGLTKLPDNVSYENALFVGDILSSGYFGAELAEVKKGDIAAVIGSGPVGLCAMICAKLMGAAKIIAIDIDESRLKIAKTHAYADYLVNPNVEDVETAVKKITSRGADAVIECAGTDETFQMAWKIARPNSVVALVAMYENPQNIPLPDMYGKNLIFKTGGVDAVHCKKLLDLISEGKISTDFLITHKITLDNIIEGFKIFENKRDTCLKIAVEPYKEH